ncbi:hypothetical protein OsJ_07983 [Oryza sativa Japonica Group]|uniref:Uncharacterized protein n=1 Tax=Oryza sativa subsp. japonica TaxID=39947 RepID=B9F1W2_ORYSJ|nr:hypothetical protein OsJ_07983 [Oryza sativa Japonica Group]
MSPAHRGYLRYSHHLHDDRTPTTPFPPEDAPDLGKEPDPAVFLSTNAGRRLEGRRRTPVAAAGCLRALATTGRRRIRVRHRRIRGLHHCHPNAVTIPAAITHNTTPRNSPRPPPSPVPAASPSRQIRPERRGSGGHRRRHSGRLPRPPEREETRSAPPPPSLWLRGFAGGRSGDGEAEKGVGVGERGGRVVAS